VGIFQYIAPSVSLVIAVWLYGEPFTRVHTEAFACIWAALALYSWEGLGAGRTSSGTAGERERLRGPG
jgi:chloramphenicol-sensitive protein RarD